MKLKRWLMVIRAPFLPLSLVLAFLGSCIAWFEGGIHLGHALLAAAGLVLAHVSVDVFNEYFDHRSGLDFKTRRTPFSGGSGALPQGLISPQQAFWLGLGSLLVIVPVGIYFCIVKGWLLLPLLLIAAAITVLYTPFILKTGWPEWAPGLGLGFLPLLGVYFVQTGTYSLHIIVVGILSGILVHNLLFLNEFPDVEADAAVKRKTLPILIGKRKASLVYAGLTVMVYLWIIGSVVAGQMPVFTLIGLLTLPLAVIAIRGALGYRDRDRLIGGMAANVQVVLFTQVLLGIGYILARVF